MIELAAIAEAIPRLTGEAVKVAVYLAAHPADRADSAFVVGAAKEIGTTPHLFRKALNELAKEGVIELKNRVSLSGVRRSLARISSEAPGSPDGEEPSAPWLRSTPGRVPTSEARSGVGLDPEGGHVASEAKPEDNGDPCPRSGSGPPLLAPFVIVRDAWFASYAAANDGRKPTWGGRVGKMVHELLASHDADEIVRRMDIMFTEPRKFPPPPYDFPTLRYHFDKFAVSRRPTGGMIGLDRMKDEAYYGEVDDV